MYYNEKKIRIVEVVLFLDMNDLNFCIEFNRSVTENWEIFWKLPILSTLYNIGYVEVI